MSSSQRSGNSSHSSRRNTKGFKCPGCGQICLTHSHLIDHMKTTLMVECRSHVQTCLKCFKDFSSPESLNRHLGQSPLCQLEVQKPDLASIVPYKASKSKTSPVIIPVQSSVSKRSKNVPEDIPQSISFSALHESQDDPDSDYPLTPPNYTKYDYHKYYLQKTDEYVDYLIGDKGTLIARINPHTIQVPSPNGRNRCGSAYDSYILRVVQETESVLELLGVDGIAVTDSFSQQVYDWIQSIIDAIDTDFERENNDFILSPDFTDAPPSLQIGFDRMKIDEVWKFLRAHIKLYDENGQLKMSLDTIPSRNHDLSSFEGEQLSSVQGRNLNFDDSRSSSSVDASTVLVVDSGTHTASIALLGTQSTVGIEEPPPATLMLKDEATARQEHQASEIFTPKDSAYIALFDLLQNSGVPIHLFDDVLQWASKYGMVLQDCSPSTRNTFIRNLRLKVYGFTQGPSALMPFSDEIALGSGSTISVTKFPFTSSLVSMLMNQDLMRDENLLLNPNDPFSLPPEDCLLGDVNTGRWYRDTWSKLCTVPKRDVLLNLIGFSDETVTDKFGKQSLHPFSITLGIFNRATRNLAKAWTNLGYMPRFENGSKDKVQDVHDVYKYLMSEIWFLQTQGGFHWDLYIGGRTHKVVFKVAIQFIIGDCEGHDEICGRKKGHSLVMKGLCRDCDCLPSQADDPDHECHFLKSSALESESEDELAERGFHHITNAFYRIELGSNPGGIFSATPPEHLHQMSGLTDYLFAHFKSTLSGPTRKHFDTVMQQIYANFSRQSQRDLHTLTPFRNGIFVKTSCLSSKEKVARIFALYIVLHIPSAFEHMATTVRMKKDTDTETNISIGPIGYEDTLNWMCLLEAMLVFDAWMKSPLHDPRDIRGDVDDDQLSWPWQFQSPCMTACRKLMHLYKKMVKRTEGTGLKLTKFHQILHHVKTISEHGSLLNVDSGRPESTHKVNTKDQSKKTQRRMSTLSQQTAIRLSEDILVRDAKSSFVKHDDVSQPHDRRSSQFVGSRFHLNVTPLGRNCYESRLNWLGTPSETHLDSDMCQSLTQRLFFHLGPGGCLHLNSLVKGFTEYKPEEGVIFRAHPDYLVGKPWYDWALINWSDNDDDSTVLVPARLRLFLDLSEAHLMSDEEHREFCREYRFNRSRPARMPMDNEPYPYLDNGKWVLIQSAEEAVDESQENCNKPSMKMSSRFKLERNFRLVPIESISDVAFSVLHDPSESSEDADVTGFVLKSKDEWRDAFPTYFHE